MTKPKYCAMCATEFTSKYRTALCPHCNKIYVLQQKIDKMSPERKRQELSKYQRIAAQFRMSLSAYGCFHGTWKSAKKIAREHK